MDAAPVAATPSTAVVSDWAAYVRVGTYKKEGVSCTERPGEHRGKALQTLFYKQAIYRVETRGDWSLVRPGAGRGVCWVRTTEVEALHSSPILCPSSRTGAPLVPLKDLLRSRPRLSKRRPVGRVWPTFYHLAREDLRPRLPGEKSDTLWGLKGPLVQVSPSFGRAVRLQGTGKLKSGEIVNVSVKKGGFWRFRMLPKGVEGKGIHGYHLYAYRSAAVDFSWLCRRLEMGDCSRPRRLAGSLLYVPRLKGAKLADGSSHDGFVCAVDVGGGIRGPRMDLFVGDEGAGNPYYPDCRSTNSWLQHGVQSLVPWDWRSFRKGAKGRWRPADKLEYQRTAVAKGLEVFFVPGGRCRKRASGR